MDAIAKPKLFGESIVTSGKPGVDGAAHQTTGEDIYSTLDDAVDSKIIDGLNPVESAMVCAVSNTDLLDKGGLCLQRHTVTQAYFRRLMYGLAQFSELIRSELDDAFKHGTDQFFGRFTGNGSSHLGAHPNGHIHKYFKDRLPQERFVDGFSSVVDLPDEYVFDMDLATTEPIRRRVKSKCGSLTKKLTKNGLFAPARIIDAHQEHRFSGNDQLFKHPRKKKDDPNYSPQIMIHHAYIGERQVVGALAYLEATVLEAIEMTENDEDVVFKAPRFCGALDMLHSMTGKNYSRYRQRVRMAAQSVYDMQYSTVEDLIGLGATVDQVNRLAQDAIAAMSLLDPARADEMQKNYDALVKKVL